LIFFGVSNFGSFFFLHIIASFAFIQFGKVFWIRSNKLPVMLNY
jgi:hypothetical protein